MISVILPIIFGVGFLLWFIVEGIYERQVWVNSIDLFVPILGAKMRRARGSQGGRCGYIAEGRFQNWEVCIRGKKCGFLKGQFGVNSVSVKLNQFKYKSKRLGGVGQLSVEGSDFCIRGDYLGLAIKEIKSINLSNEIVQAITRKLEVLCKVAHKLDTGEIACDSIAER